MKSVKKMILPILVLLLVGCASDSSAPLAGGGIKDVQVTHSETGKEGEAAGDSTGSGETEADESGTDDVIRIDDTESDKDKTGQTDINLTASENHPATVSSPTIVIDFAGDIDFDDGYSNMIALRSDPNGISGRIGESLLKRMNAADICMINNEFPYSDRGTPLPNKKFTFRAKPETASFLKVMGADIVGLANNHAYDYGPDALLDTFDTLESEGIPYVGAGRNVDEAKRPYYFVFGDTTVAFAAATQIERSLPPDTKEATATEPGVLRTLDPTAFCGVLKEAKEHSDFVVAFVHWGTENTNEQEESQRELARAYAEAGADLIIGAHPHVLQGFEYIDGVPVMYSLGNFWFNSKTLDTCIVEATIKDKKLASLQFVPCIQQNCRTTMQDKGTAEYIRILKEERSYSNGVEIDEAGFVRSESA